MCKENNIPASSPNSSVAVGNIFSGIYFAFLLIFHCIVRFVIEPLASQGVTFNYGGEFNYLTEWLTLILIVYWAVCLLDFVAHFRDWSDITTEKIHRFRNAYFATVAFPLTVSVGVTFVLLIGYYGETNLTKLVRVWQHIGVTIAAFIELFAFGHEYGYGGRWGTKGLWIQNFISFLIPLTYLIISLVLSQDKYNGKYPYPFQYSLNTPAKAVAGYGALLLFHIFNYWLGYWINLAVWVMGVCCCRGQNKDASSYA